MTESSIKPSELEQWLSAYSDDLEAPATTYNSPFLRLLVSADRGQLSRSFSERVCAPGEVVFREGLMGDTMYLIRSGRVVVLKGDLQSPTILGYRRAGEIIGEMALLENRPRSATVVALDALRLLGINRQAFQQLVEETPSLGMNLMALLSSRLRASDEDRSQGKLSEKRLLRQVSTLKNEKERLEEMQRLRQETSDLIIHDLRNPLSTISVALRMLTIVLPPEALEGNQELIEIAESGAQRMQRLVDSLLEVSRMEAGEAEFNLSKIDPAALISEVAHRESLLLQKKNIHLELRLSPDLPLVCIDRDKIDRVLVNLIDNAFKYTLEDGRVTISAEACEGGVQIGVSDSGPGIPIEERQRVFERFAQVAGEARKRRGFGLGLSYCRLAVEGHGGRIWVEEGAGGVGSRFVFTVPATVI